MKKVIFALVALMMISCVNPSKNDNSSKLLESQDIKIMVVDEDVITYDPENFQIGFNVKNGRYWVCNDKMDEFYIVEIVDGDLDEATKPNVVKANVYYSTADSPVHTTSGISLEVLDSKRIENLTRYYLYSKTESLGIVIARE